MTFSPIPLNVGDRVTRPRLKWRDEVDRFGEVVEIYKGAPNGQGYAPDFVAIKWDDTELVERGYLRRSNIVHRYIVCPTVTAK